MAGRDGGRGVVDPTARAIVAPGAAFAAAGQGLIGRPGRYLHPYLTIGPQGVLALAKEAFHEAAVHAA